MNSTKPLSYPCLKSVISYCEANLRFILADRIPAIGDFEKLVPLKVHFLQFHSDGFKVNETDYSFSIVKRHPKTQEKDEFLEEFSNDFDEFGCPDHSTITFVNPGDIVLPPSIYDSDSRQSCSESDDDSSECMEEACMEEELEELLEIKREIEKADDESDSEELRSLNDEIEELQDLIACYHNRRHNIHPNYEMFIQLAVTISNGKQNAKLMKYDVSMFESMRNLSTQFFGGRNCAVNVKIFDTTDRPHILRVPEGLKLRIEQLHVSSSATPFLTCIQPLLDESCLPLKKLSINDFSDREENYSHPIITNASELVLDFPDLFVEYIPHRVCMFNRKVQLKLNSFSYSEGSMIALDLIECCLAHKKVIGAWYLITAKRRKFPVLRMLRERKDAISRKFDGSTLRPNCITLPMQDFMELNIFVTNASKPSQCTLNIKVEEEGSAERHRPL